MLLEHLLREIDFPPEGAFVYLKSQISHGITSFDNLFDNVTRSFAGRLAYRHFPAHLHMAG